MSHKPYNPNKICHNKTHVENSCNFGRYQIPHLREMRTDQAKKTRQRLQERSP